MNQESFAGKVAVVTGAARGIGKNIARILGEAGATVVICDLDKATLETTEAELCAASLDVSSMVVDLSRSQAAHSVIQDVVQKTGKLDILVNNARSGKRMAFLDENEVTWDETMAVTLKAAFFCSQEAIRVMKTKDSGGVIVNISSVAALAVSQESPSYHIAKAGLLQATRLLAVNGGPYGVRVNALLPGFVVQDEHQPRYRSPNNQSYRETAEYCHPLGRTGFSADIANAVSFLCSENASFITGQCLTIDGGLLLQDPSCLAFRLQHDMPGRK